MGDGAMVHNAEEHHVVAGKLADEFAVGDGVALVIEEGVGGFVLRLEAEDS